MTAAPVVPIRDSIATRLLAVVFSIYFGVTLTVTLVHMTAEYYNTKQAILEDLAVFQKTFEPSVATAVWNLDQDQLNSSLQGIVTIPIIVGAKIQDSSGELVGAAGVILNQKGAHVMIDQNNQQIPIPSEGAFSQLFGYTFTLHYSHQGKLKEIGTLTFYSSTEVIFKKVQYGFLFILVNSIIKTMALWVIFILVGRAMLNRPLAILTAATQRLNMDNLESLKIDIQTQGRNELKLLEEAFNSMIQKLILAKERTTSLRMFANRLSSFKDSTQTFLFAFQELCRHTEINNAVFLYGSMEQNLTPHQFNVQAHPFLTQVPPKEWMLETFNGQELVVFNRVEHDHPIHQIYAGFPGARLTNSHFAYIQSPAVGDYIICLYREAGTSPFDQADQEYIRSVLSEVKVAHHNIYAIRENARMENELRTAAAVQQALFPKELPEFENLTLASYFQSASETGGDWYGFVTQIENFLYLMIGDVTGHGTPAALVTATASATCQTLEQMYAINGERPSPAAFLRHLNAAVYKAGAPNFLMTFFIARIDLENGEVCFANASHNFPLLLRQDGKIEHLLNVNRHLGRDLDAQFNEGQTYLRAGDKLLLFTDGVIENTNSHGEMWGESRLVRYLKENRHLKISAMVTQLMQSLHRFHGGEPLGDDMTLVACEVTRPFPKQL